MSKDPMVVELERLLSQVNQGLKDLLKTRITGKKTREALIDLERKSRWKTTSYIRWTSDVILGEAKAKARLKAQEYGSDVVVALKRPDNPEEPERYVVVTMARFFREHPFGMTANNIVFKVGPDGESNGS